MPFRLRKDTRAWFRDVQDAFTLDFDMYQLCLMAGLATGRKSPVRDEETTVLVEHFPGDYRATGRLILAFFLTVELEQLGVRRADRSQLHATINGLVDPSDPSFLSNEGMRAVNQYSYGGFDAISEWFDQRPHTFEGFFSVYKKKLDDAMSGLSRVPL